MIKFDRNTLIVRGTKPQAFAKLIKRQSHFEAQSVIMELAEWALSSMKGIISSSAKRPLTGNLANNLTLDSFGGAGSAYFEVGVGNIELLNSNAEYWQVLNSGSKRTGERFKPYNGKYVPKGSFEGSPPQAGGSGGTWNKGQGNYSFKATKFIDPTNYIDITIDGLKTQFWQALVRIDKGLDTKIGW